MHCNTLRYITIHYSTLQYIHKLHRCLITGCVWNWAISAIYFQYPFVGKMMISWLIIDFHLPYLQTNPCVRAIRVYLKYSMTVYVSGPCKNYGYLWYYPLAIPGRHLPVWLGCLVSQFNSPPVPECLKGLDSISKEWWLGVTGSGKRWRTPKDT